MGLLHRCQAALVRRQKQAIGRRVVYTRGDSGVMLEAWLGNTLFARNTEEPGASVVWGERDYLFLAADLVIDGRMTLPMLGDRIIETIDGEEVQFELQTATGEPPWRFSDSMRTTIRVNTKRQPKRVCERDEEP